ncbi:MAG TPA: acetylxylan esterase [Planctomicrobium sp.]|nr:acetylxylan esterase [Planctomicrobium sp.]
MRFAGLSCSLFVCFVGFCSHDAMAQAPQTHTDESKVPQYTLPDPLVFSDGKPVISKEDWIERRRPQILELFTREVYGKSPPAPATVKYEVISVKEDALDGKAIRKEIAVTLVEKPLPVVMTILLYLPKSVEKAPVFFGLNFWGNHAITPETDVQLNPNWMTSRAEGVIDSRATEASRGTRTNRWPVSLLIERGYGLATAYYGDIDPDFDDSFKNGIHPAFLKEGQKKPSEEEWGSIAAWAWGLSRGLDALEQIPGVDGTKVAVLGHSRLGKTSLWAGASDPRFAIVISNDSGCGGAALSRRQFGETVARINHSFPHWFCDNFNKYNDKESELPVDQHELIALIAPRPVYVASATGDLWADPKGEFLSAVHADPVYRLLGTDGFGGEAPPQESPAPDHPLKTGTIGYHLRTGKHDLTTYDWEQYLDFADRHYKAAQK